MKFKFSETATERIILSIDFKNNYASRISRVAGVTQGTMVKILKDLKDGEIIEKIDKWDRMKSLIVLTEKGIKIKSLIRELRKYNGR